MFAENAEQALEKGTGMKEHFDRESKAAFISTPNRCRPHPRDEILYLENVYGHAIERYVTRREISDAFSFVLFLAFLPLGAVAITYAMRWALQSISRMSLS